MPRDPSMMPDISPTLTYVSLYPYIRMVIVAHSSNCID